MRNTSSKNYSKKEHFALILVVFVIIHGAFFLYGVLHPDVFLAGDRSTERIEKIAYVFNQDEVARGFNSDIMTLRIPADEGFLARMMDSGHPGDYIVQGALLAAGGVNAVLAFQLALLLLAVICIYSLVIKLGRSPTTALIASSLYMCLPGSLVQSHQLSSESIYNPIVVFGFYFLISFFQRRSRYTSLIFGLFLLSIAMFVRPQLLLYPIVLFIIVATHYRSVFDSRALIIIPVCLLLSIIWSAFVFQGTGKLSVGSKEYGPGVAFMKTAQRMSVIGNYEFEGSTTGSTTLSISDFGTQVLSHPASFIKLKTHELVNLVINPGVFSVAAHHLDLLPGGGDTEYWKQLRDHQGIVGTIKEITRRDAGTVFALLGGAFVWGVVLLLTVVGCYRVVRSSRISRISKAIMFSCVLYGLLIVLVAGEGRWAHRTSVEFLLVIFSAMGVDQLKAWMRRVPAVQARTTGVI